MNTSFISKLAFGALNMQGLTIAGLDPALGGSIYGKPFAVKEGTEDALRKPIKDKANLSVESNEINPLEAKEVSLSHDMTGVSGEPIPSTTFPSSSEENVSNLNTSNEGQYDVNIPVLVKPQDPMFVQQTFEEPTEDATFGQLPTQEQTTVNEVDAFGQSPTQEKTTELSGMVRQADPNIRTEDFDRKVLGAKEKCFTNIAVAIDGLVDELEKINSQKIESTVAEVSGEIDAANTQIQAAIDNTPVVQPEYTIQTPQPFNQVPQQPTL